MESSSLSQSSVVVSLTTNSVGSFSGQISGSSRHGIGCFTWISGEKYDGNWVDDFCQGFGTMIYPCEEVEMKVCEGDREETPTTSVALVPPSSPSLLTPTLPLLNIKGEKKISDTTIKTQQNRPKYDIYEGFWVKNKKHGKGTFRFSCGDIFIGEFSDDVIDGSGVYVWSDGETFSGTWEKGKRIGKDRNKTSSCDDMDTEVLIYGTLRSKLGDLYIGELKEKVNLSLPSAAPAPVPAPVHETRSRRISVDGVLVKHGHGISISQGEIYEGEFKNNFREGVGTVRFLLSGSSYTGEFKENLKHGKGLIKYANMDEFEGLFVEDKKSGFGTIRYANGDVYCGELLNDKRHGKGKINYANSDVYEGFFFEGKRHGRGKKIYSDGSSYDGEWVEGRKEGRAARRENRGGEKKEMIININDACNFH